MGQYFTGTGLGRLLAALAEAPNAKSIVDPMVGSGDLLAACLEVGARPSTMAGIEVDPNAHELCRARIPEVDCLLGSAFNSETLTRLSRTDWDLVIANPPYVRYQTLSRSGTKGTDTSSALGVRESLQAAIDHLQALDETDRRLLRAITAGYSGHADLAVPAWILCAALAKVGGRIALVLPESWLSRNYAAAVQYILLRWYRVEVVVVDEHAVWFPDAQIKTTLLVARRTKRRRSAFDWADDEHYIHSTVTASAAGPTSPIARAYPDSNSPELSFAEDVRRVQTEQTDFRSPKYTITRRSVASMAESLAARVENQRWWKAVQDSVPRAMGLGQRRLANVLPLNGAWLGDKAGVAFSTLDATGVSIGQGLRTGANRFFYVELLGSYGDNAIVRSELLEESLELSVPKTCLRPLVRKQSDIADRHFLRTSDLRFRVLDLRELALPEDIAAAGELARRVYQPMPAALAEYVRLAQRGYTPSGGVKQDIRHLSAVAPNIRSANEDRGIPARFWYMLPAFAQRHTPQLIVPRVVGGSVRAVVLEEDGIIADANFTTLRTSSGEGYPDALAVFSLLNSSWTRAILEHTASVMGGGALKVEATHLRRLPVPALDRDDWALLSQLGKRATIGETVHHEVDAILLGKILGRRPRDSDHALLAEVARDALARRRGHRKPER